MAGGPALFIKALCLYQLFEQAQLIVRIEDGEIGFEIDQFGVAAQDLDANGVEGAQPLHAFHRAADQGADPILHFARGLVGEGHRQDLPGRCPARGKDVSDAGGQHTGLAGASACQHKQGSIMAFHRVTLLGIEAIEIGNGTHARQFGPNALLIVFRHVI